MSGRIVVDVGNTRVKFGRCSSSQVTDHASLAHDANDWDSQVAQWALTTPCAFVVAGVAPKTVAELSSWATSRGHRCRVIASHAELPLNIDVDHPESVGIDRLLGALAAKSQFPAQSLLVVDAGSAITVNQVDEAGTFRGGAILPGLALMARVLHERTAKLPLVDPKVAATFPGRDTDSAIRLGMQAAACGAVERLAAVSHASLLVFTGGDGEWLESQVSFRAKRFVPRLVLEGIRIVAEAQP